MSRYKPWHAHQFVKDERYSNCAVCSHPKGAAWHKRPKRFGWKRIFSNPWRIYG